MEGFISFLDLTVELMTISFGWCYGSYAFFLFVFS